VERVERVLRVALTGGIATGKSHVLNELRQRGVPCLDADALAHGVMAAGTEATMAIVARFGAEVLAVDGSVDRAALAPRVFPDPVARRDLEAIVHPAVYRAIAAGLRGLELTGSRLAVVDVPLLYETGHEGDFDRVIATTCPVETQIARLVARGLSESDARQRIGAQWPSEKKAARADYVIHTDRTFADTRAQVEQVLGALRSMM
jgi:dephospho-CoA kinase